MRDRSGKSLIRLPPGEPAPQKAVPQRMAFAIAVLVTTGLVVLVVRQATERRR